MTYERKVKPKTPPKGRRVERRHLAALMEESVPHRRLQYGCWLLLGGILFLSPYFRGLFFQREQQWALLFACLAFVMIWVVKLQQREVSFVGKPLDYLILAFAVLYVLGVFGAASQRLAVAEVVKFSLYFLVYWMVSELGREERGSYFLAGVIYAAALGVALAGILTAQGIIHIKDGFLDGRICSTLQYPNALAAYLGSVSFLGLLLWTRAALGWRFVLAGGNYILFTVMLATGSRGCVMIYPLVLLLFIIGAPASYRGRLCWHVSGGWGAALVAVRFLTSILADDPLGSWQWLALGLLAALAVQAVGEVAGRLQAVRLWKVGVALLGLAAAGGAFCFLWLAGRAVPAGTMWQSIMPASLVARLVDISLTTSSAALRLQYSQDALMLVKARPLLGYGGGAWEAAYHSVQSFSYISTQVHNHYFQIWTEVGTVGLVVFLAIWVCFFFTALGNWRRGSSGEHLFQWALLAAALILGLHAILDFDLALSSVALVLYTCFGLTRALERRLKHEKYYLRRQEYQKARVRYLVAVVAAALVIGWLPAGLLAGEATAGRALAAAEAEREAQAIEYLRKASILDPFTASYQMYRAELLLKQGKRGQAVALAERAARKERFNRDILTRLGNVYWQTAAVDAAVRSMEQARQAAPWIADGWENSGRVAALAGVRCLLSGEEQKARQYFEQAAAIPAQVRAKIAGLAPETYRLWQKAGKALLEVTPTMELNAGIALYGLGQPRETLRLVGRAMNDKNIRAHALFWASLAQRQLGNQEDAETLRREAEAMNPSLAGDYKAMLAVRPLQ